MDNIIQDIFEIFNLPDVQLVRLSGLTLREKKIDVNISPQSINRIIFQLKKRNAINFNFIIYCPFCKEIFYIISNDIKIKSTKICDTCSSTFYISSINSLNSIEDVENILNTFNNQMFNNIKK